jgi:hypothetical protein
MEQKIDLKMLSKDLLNLLTLEQCNNILEMLDVNRDSYPVEFTAKAIIYTIIKYEKYYMNEEEF